jgi:hypothetical protein
MVLRDGYIRPCRAVEVKPPQQRGDFESVLRLRILPFRCAGMSCQRAMVCVRAWEDQHKPLSCDALLLNTVAGRRWARVGVLTRRWERLYRRTGSCRRVTDRLRLPEFGRVDARFVRALQQLGPVAQPDRAAVS